MTDENTAADAIVDPSDALADPSTREAWDPRVRTMVASVALGLRDWRGILPFFDREVPDLDGASAYIETTYADYPVILKQCRFALEAARLVPQGQMPDLSKIRLVNLKQILNFLIMAGQLDTLRTLLPVCAERWDMRRIHELSTMMMPGEETLGPLPALDRTWLDWQVFTTGAETTLILFSGAAGKFGMETNVLLPWLTDLPCNIILARDAKMKLYLDGIRSLGPDKTSTVAAIQAQLAELGTRRLVTAGNSGGVYAALDYGCLLKADQVLCFAGPTTLDGGFEAMEDRPIYEAIAAAIEAGTLHAPDLIAELTAARLDIRYFHGDDNPFDTSQAARIRAIPGTSVEPIEGWAGHFVQGELIRRGLFKAIWRDAVTGAPAPVS